MHGEVVRQQQITPFDDASFGIGYLRACRATDDGIVALGETTSFTGAGPVKNMRHFLWAVDLAPQLDCTPGVSSKASARPKQNAPRNGVGAYTVQVMPKPHFSCP
jgi:hypothetical protein